MIFLGPLYEREQENEILKKSHVAVSNAGNTFQWNIIDGILENRPEKLKIINVLPVGTWGKYSELLLPNRKWKYKNYECEEVGCVNLPVIKQCMRAWRIARMLNNSNDNEIVICTAYLPFLKAAYKLGREKKVTAIITDIPEYYDMHRVSRIRKLLRIVHNRIVYRYMQRVDRFVLLTEQMAEPLQVGNRPYIVMEGICSEKNMPAHEERNNSILYTGRLNFRYGLENLIDAFGKIDDETAELWICGSGEMEKDILRAAEQDSRIKFMGFKSHTEICKLQKKAAVLVNPRNNSGEYTKYSFPSKTMEYMASGTPVVMYKLEGVPAEYDKYLIYADSDSSDGLKESLEWALNMSAQEREMFGQKAARYVTNNKNACVQAKRILEFIGEV